MSLDRNPIWQSPVQRVTLVESIAQPGMLAVAKRGCAKVVPLPQGYDGYTQVHLMSNGQAMVWHPTLSALVCDFNTLTHRQVDIPREFMFKDKRARH